MPSLVVTTTAGTVDATDGVTSLREAVAYANAHAGADTITFDGTVFDGAEDIIRLNSELSITDDLTIQGNTFDVLDATGLSRVTISGDSLAGGGLIGAGDTDGVGDTRVFNVAANFVDVSFADLVIRDGFASGADGGGIRAGNSDITLDRVTLTENRTTSGGGGGMYAQGSGTRIVRDSVITDNYAARSGGGLSISNFQVIGLHHLRQRCRHRWRRAGRPKRDDR